MRYEGRALSLIPFNADDLISSHGELYDAIHSGVSTFEAGVVKSHRPSGGAENLTQGIMGTTELVGILRETSLASSSPDAQLPTLPRHPPSNRSLRDFASPLPPPAMAPTSQNANGLPFTQSLLASMVIEELPADRGVPPAAEMQHWAVGTYKRIDQAINVSKLVFRLEQEWLQNQVIRSQSDNNAKARLDAMVVMQGIAKDLAELTTLKARLRLWELFREENPPVAAAQFRRSQS
ncbi:hypothetical protein CALCODRAFT_538003 [Calocera cornea HHB12733]|uniref:Uncharacterized protein n=1 Tax=Calocera cornea HHB12733 TaxID=1353952 RepID=A0A165HCC4_9BASI|nr:hypothetical protein CALCODRAFT_538003 [Calocera cornea HHB12733]